MTLKEIAIFTVYKHPLSKMNFTTWCVQEQYWSYLKKYDTKQWQKVVVQVDDSLDAKNNDFSRDDTAVDVAVLKRHFDIRSYLSLSDEDKKRTLLELLHRSMLFLADVCGWDAEPLFKAYGECLNSKLEYRGNIKNKLFRSPNRRLFGSVEWYWDIGNFKAIGIITTKHGEVLKRQTLLDIEPYFGETIYHCNCKWLDDYTFCLHTTDNRKKWEINLLTLISS